MLSIRWRVQAKGGAGVAENVSALEKSSHDSRGLQTENKTLLAEQKVL